MEEGYDYDWLCIGSGPAGQRAAAQAAKLGKRVAVIERGHVVGGACVDTGTIPSKTFREAVISLKRRALQNGSYRHSISDVRISAQALFSRVAEVEQSQADVVADQLRRNDVTVLMGEASFQDPHTVTVISADGCRVVSAAKILIAVGTTPALPPGAASSLISSSQATNCCN